MFLPRRERRDVGSDRETQQQGDLCSGGRNDENSARERAAREGKKKKKIELRRDATNLA